MWSKCGLYILNITKHPFGKKERKLTYNKGLSKVTLYSIIPTKRRNIQLSDNRSRLSPFENGDTLFSLSDCTHFLTILSPTIWYPAAKSLPVCPAMGRTILILLGSFTQFSSFSSSTLFTAPVGCHAESYCCCQVFICGSSGSSVLHLPRSTSSSKIIPPY
jgi:hypothetical protein